MNVNYGYSVIYWHNIIIVTEETSFGKKGELREDNQRAEYILSLKCKSTLRKMLSCYGS